VSRDSTTDWIRQLMRGRPEPDDSGSQPATPPSGSGTAEPAEAHIAPPPDMSALIRGQRRHLEFSTEVSGDHEDTQGANP
jgi:hypothetical protein